MQRKVSRKQSAAPPLPPALPEKPAVLEKAVALFAYDAQRPDELNLVEGDKVEVTKKDASGWWEGILSGKKGLFPGNYVEIVKS